MKQKKMPAHRKDGAPPKKKANGRSAQYAAELYVKNLTANHKNRKTDKEIFMEAGYSETTSTPHIVNSDRFQMMIKEILPEDKILKRIKQGLGKDVKDSTALGFCRLGLEVHGKVGPKANINNVNVENANILVADLLSWQPPGIAQAEVTDITNGQ